MSLDPDEMYEWRKAMEHEGFSRHRLDPKQNNPSEVAFAAQWKEENDANRKRELLEWIIPDCTDRDAKVAATVIQWLGSNVGMDFLRNVMKREPKIMERLR